MPTPEPGYEELDPPFALVRNVDPFNERAGEFSGVEGVVQPPPHEPTRSEQAMLDRQQYNGRPDSV